MTLDPQLIFVLGCIVGLLIGLTAFFCIRSHRPASPLAMGAIQPFVHVEGHPGVRHEGSKRLVLAVSYEAVLTYDDDGRLIWVPLEQCRYPLGFG